MDLNTLFNNLKQNKINSFQLTYPNLKKYFNILINSLKINSSLYLLNINNCNLNDEDLIQLLDSIKSNIFLEYLYLQFNNITNISLLSDYLIDNTHLISLDLGCNKISDINPLVEILKSNNTLQYLYLYNNQIIDIIPLIDLLKTNNTLKCINLYKNYIFDINILFYIIDVIKINKGLHTLILSFKHKILNKKVLKQLLKTIKLKINEISHKTFYLDIDLNNITYNYFIQK